jgi:hypothetical protein
MVESGIPEKSSSPTSTRPPSRWRKGLSLRLAMGLIVLVAVAFGAWMHHLRTLRAGLETIRQHRGMYYFDHEYIDDVFVPKPRSWAPRWLRELVGDEGLHDVSYVRIIDRGFNDDDLAQLTRCFPRIKNLGLEGTSITDRGLAYLRGNQTLEAIFAGGTKITDSGIDRLGLETVPKMEGS